MNVLSPDCRICFVAGPTPEARAAAVATLGSGTGWTPAEFADTFGAKVIGLTVSPDRLIQIRRNRLLSLKENRESTYIDHEAVREEIVQAFDDFQRGRF